MVTAGMYETSGRWLYEVGLPAKSGIGSGIVTVSPGKGGVGTFAPPLDRHGNSVKGQLVASFLSRRLGLDLLSSRPSGESRQRDQPEDRRAVAGAGGHLDSPSERRDAVAEVGQPMATDG